MKACDGKLDLLCGRAHPLAQPHPEFAFRAIRQRLNPSGYIVEMLQAVFQAFFDTDNFEDCLTDLVNRSGDADTTGAIAGMLAGAVYGPASMSWHWLHGLDPAIRHAREIQARELARIGDHGAAQATEAAEA